MLFEVPAGAKLRHEWKHLISPADKQAIIDRLRVIAKPDPHYGDGEYHIRSLYFDNVYDKALSERLNGVAVREKFRIRYYNADPSYIMLEKKSKFNTLCDKRSARITQAECQRIIDGDYEWLGTSDRQLLRELYTKMRMELLRPAVIVDYHRRAFVYAPGNVRVTIDDCVRTGLRATQMFDPVQTIPADIRKPIILEVKYDAFCPDIIRDAVQLSNSRTSSYSKYTSCRLTDY